MLRRVWDEFEDTCHGGLDDYRKDLVIYSKCDGNPLDIADSESQFSNLCCKIKVDGKSKNR